MPVLSVHCHDIRADVRGTDLAKDRDGWVEITINENQSEGFTIQLWNTKSSPVKNRRLLSTTDIAAALEQPAMDLEAEKP